jgi:hypothetical protein
MNEGQVRVSVYTDTMSVVFDSDEMIEGKGGWDVRSRHSKLSSQDIIEFTEIIESLHTIVNKLVDAK